MDYLDCLGQSWPFLLPPRPEAQKADQYSFGSSAINSVQLLEFFLCFNQKRNIRVGVSPEREEVLISLARFYSIALKRGCAGEAGVCERIQSPANRPPAILQNLLKLSSRFRTLI